MSKLRETNKKIETAVTDGYKAIEEGVVTGYKAIEEGVVTGFKKVEDKFIGAFLTEEGETVEEARARLSGQAKAGAEAPGKEEGK